MRPQQQNRRMRGRGNNSNNNNNNRRGPNPLTRNYESNGPDVKIRGSAQQIAEKYTNLARDAQSAGDRVIAENYLQHAEHYNRIIATAQAQMPQQQNRDQRDLGDDADDERDDRDENSMSSSSDNPRSDNQRKSADDGSGPQPVIEGVPVEVQQEVMSREDSQQRQASNGHGGQAEADGDAPRRPKRPRRSRSRAEQDGGTASEGQEAGSGEDEKSELTASAAE